MIGVIAGPSEHDAVREFFELFKTPWEFYRNGRQYDVLLCTVSDSRDEGAKLVILYAGKRTDSDDRQKVKTNRGAQPAVLTYRRNRIPIYGDSVTFPEAATSLLADVCSHEAAAYLDQSGPRVTVRVGYDLFGEVSKLLTVGQPPSNADMPALELHIALLRDLITECGVAVVEVPPVPQGYSFTVCLTHDVDHPSIRQHRWDHTMLGFLFRAVLGSLHRWMSGRISFRNVWKNWAAAAKLPLVYLGLARDFWRDFDDCYLELENGLPSTFFVIPFKDCPGSRPDGPAPRLRAAAYGAADIANAINKLMAAGCEVGLHGIDAWFDSDRAVKELEEIRRLTGPSEIGVRMHWLYYDGQSSATLEKAGAAYDSTIGYNEAVGYRAGATQVYKPLQAARLLELPLHVMDTALFYTDYLGLSPEQATAVLARLVDNAAKFGGCLTINWHDRSLAPERLWDKCYQDLIQNLKSRGAWFATAGQATDWFRKRRSVLFETGSTDQSTVCARMSADRGSVLPGLRLRIHKAQELCRIGARDSDDFVDTPFDESVGAGALCGVQR